MSESHSVGGRPDEPGDEDTPRPTVAPIDLAGLVRNIGYEVMPFKKTEASVLQHVPKDVPLTVTAAEGRGLDATLDLAVALARAGYRVAPHLAARLVEDHGQLRRITERLDEAGIRSLFVIGGDAPEPHGPFSSAKELIDALDGIGFSYENLGVGGYPEGHASIPEAALDTALHQKATHADRIITQICFAPDTIAAWASRLEQAGVHVPIHLGVPGPVNRQKLMRISAGIGLGQSARFLQKQQNLVWRLLVPGGYNPTRLLRRLGKTLSQTPTYVSGLHIFTFNELERTEAWRQKLLASVRA
ncbi:methylenetetrahydrofolate reductase [Egicoccus halophilus]|uniref:Methylenetetrahydrofolate reductase n=1 Tax=Egicoccus halophilus TaxID=1670830 RepID=A0A8J3ACB4_9ACTN|nr:methylenetetrahydrofolate reductase [Egicoccus halophilus]GGI04110.1 methylenetetrahydrofolate reductase [Egicoccus halophilus]